MGTKEFKCGSSTNLHSSFDRLKSDIALIHALKLCIDTNAITAHMDEYHYWVGTNVYRVYDSTAKEFDKRYKEYYNEKCEYNNKDLHLIAHINLDNLSIERWIYRVKGKEIRHAHGTHIECFKWDEHGKKDMT